MRHLKIFEEFLAEAANFKTLKEMLEDIPEKSWTRAEIEKLISDLKERERERRTHGRCSTF
jgi:hypothetical protein